MDPHTIVSREAWLAARTVLLAKEKAFTRARDDLARERRTLPWVRVDKAYAFHGADGTLGLADLFDGKSQLIVVHFMFGPDWKEGCPICSFRADGLDGMLAHLGARDVALVAVSRAPLAVLTAFKDRMGWGFPWVSSLDSDFNFDFGVSFSQAQVDAGEAIYNYEVPQTRPGEAHGVSVFCKDPADGSVFHTYSNYARGDDILMSAYNYLDLTPKGRDEAGLPYPLAWIRHHDRYGESR